MRLKSFAKNEKLSLMILLVGGLLIRLLFVSNKGYYGDITPIIEWIKGTNKFGFSWLIENFKETHWIYPPFFSYFTLFMAKIFSQSVSLEIIKFFCIIFDVFTAVLFYYFFSPGKKALLAASYWLFNPIAIVLSAVWGQLDAIPAFFLTAAFIFALKEKTFLSGIFSTLAVFSKLQYSFAIPIIFLAVWLRNGFPKVLKGGIAFSITSLILLLPLILKNLLKTQVQAVFYSFNLYPRVSLNAYNLWNAFFGGRGLEVPDWQLFLGIITYQQLGILLFFSFYFLIIWYLIKKKGATSSTLLALSLTMLSFYLFATQTHERYIHAAFIFLLPALLFNKKLKLPVFVFLITVTLSLLEVLAKTFPQFHSTIILFIDLNYQTITLLSLINLAVFVYLFFIVIQQIGLRIPLIVFSVIFLSLISKKIINGRTVVYLDTLTPASSTSQIAVNSFPGGEFLCSSLLRYERGVGAYVDSIIEYDLKGKYKEFQTEYGLGCSTSGDEKAEFLIFTDGKEIFKKQPKVVEFPSYFVPSFVKVSVKNAQVLTLKITSVENTNLQNPAGWFEAQLLK